MKTNVTLQSTDRNLFGVTIRQETRTRFLSLTDLQIAYDNIRTKEGWSERTVDKILRNKINHERIFYILEQQGFPINHQIWGFTEQVDKEGIAKVLKNLKAYKTTGRGDNRTVNCDPYIWTLVAMEMNPKLYASVITWLGDKLLLNRIEAGNMYRGLMNSVGKFPNPNYVRVAKGLNHIVFGKHETGIRNTGSAEQLKKLEDLEKQFAFSIDMGYIKTQKQLFTDLINIYNNQYR